MQPILVIRELRHDQLFRVGRVEMHVLLGSNLAEFAQNAVDHSIVVRQLAEFTNIAVQDRAIRIQYRVQCGFTPDSGQHIMGGSRLQPGILQNLNDLLEEWGLVAAEGFQRHAAVTLHGDFARTVQSGRPDRHPGDNLIFRYKAADRLNVADPVAQHQNMRLGRDDQLQRRQHRRNAHGLGE